MRRWKVFNPNPVSAHEAPYYIMADIFDAGWHGNPHSFYNITKECSLFSSQEEEQVASIPSTLGVELVSEETR